MAQTDLRFSFKLADSNTSDDPTESIHFDVVSFHLVEALNEPFVLEVELLSSNSNVDFDKLLDQGATLAIWQGKTAVRHIHGYISDFSQGNTGFRRTRYHAVIEPDLARSRLCSDWRIFQQKSVPEILKEVFAEAQLASYSLDEQSTHLPREYCVQADETNFDYIQRLTAEEGFAYRFAHSSMGHELILADVIQTFGSLSQTGQADEQKEDEVSAQPVLYQPNPAGDRPQPALRTFMYQKRVCTARQVQRDYTFKNPRYDQQQISTGHNMSAHSIEYERYDYPGRYKQDAAGIPFTQTRLASLRRDAETAHVSGDDARLEPGVAFELTGHSRSELNVFWRPVRVEHWGKQHTSAEEEAANAQVSTSYEQTAELIPATADWKAPIPPKPHLHGPEIAHVVGPEGEEIYTDEYGRVKVQFPWDRISGYSEHSSCWIRVAQNWAGAGWGHIAIPRIGQEVIVDFLDGDPDQPIITGRTYDAAHPMPYKLPALKTQQTVKSSEHKGIGYNELLFDDTTEEVKTQLHSSHGVTQLTMGFLTHPRKNDGSGEHRGDGFELRTDEWGAVRAGKGLYISTDARYDAQGKQLDLQEAMTQLEQALSVTTSLRKAASVAKAELAELQKQKDLLLNTMEDLQKAGILINSPEGVAMSSPKVVQTHAGENLIMTAGNQADLSSIHNLTINAGSALSMLGINDGVKLYAMKGDVNIQAQQDQMNLTSVKDMTVMSTRGKTEVIAKEELLLSCGGAYIRLKDGLIELGSKSNVLVRSAGVSMVGPSSLEKSGPEFNGIYKEFFILKDRTTGKILPYARYEITTEEGETYTGRADREGRTITFHTETPQNISVKILPDEISSNA